MTGKEYHWWHALKILQKLCHELRRTWLTIELWEGRGALVSQVRWPWKCHLTTCARVPPLILIHLLQNVLLGWLKQLRFCHLCGRETSIGYWAANTSPDLPGWCRYLGNEALGKGTREPGNLPLYRTHSCSILLITLVPLILSKLSNKKTNF